jgi:uncharacterized NAD-dependent epimerase/dehydratase family protein
MEGALGKPFGKMGYGLLRYSPHEIVCLIDSENAGRDSAGCTGIERHRCPVVATVEEAAKLGATAFVLGIAPPGGLIPEEWFGEIDRAVELGMSVVNGLHNLLAPRYGRLRPSQWVWDIRIEPEGLGVGMAMARELPNRRLLMVGTDMAVGKMTVGLEIVAEARRRGLRAEFVATGQIGITLVGSGVPLDAVRVDYACGAIEREVMRYADAELVVVEGQGALVHPGSTSTLPLLRGSCPTDLVLCHKAGMDHLARVPWVRVPPLTDYLRLYEDLAEACGTFARPVSAGVSLNTSHMNESDARAELERVRSDTGLAVTDAVRFGAGPLVDAVMG